MSITFKLAPFHFLPLTWQHIQLDLVFVIIEPAWDVHAAAIQPRVLLLDPPDGQGHVTLAEPPHQQVPLRQPAGH